MIHLYCRKHCTSASKAIEWFKRYNLGICIHPLSQISYEELIIVLASTDKGICEVMKHSSRLSEEEFSKISLIDTMTLNQAIDFIRVYPSLLRSPIIIEKNKVLIGYNPDKIRIFLPKEYRRKSLLTNIGNLY